VKVGARSVNCERCDGRHRVVGILEAVGTGAVTLGGYAGAIVCIAIENLLEPRFRELQSRARAGASKPGESRRKRSEGAG